ncbi:aspartate kinase [Candidatus Bathyarchaeota archaeon]|nr:aspartate kinase [Candidatus Bathyarchaeota archaeon]
MIEIENKILVVKFGGSSLAGGEKIAKAARMIAKKLKDGVKVVVVVSAMGRTTDELLKTIDSASLSKAKPADIADVLSMGERTSARIFSAALNSLGFKARYLDPQDEKWPIITDDSFMNAEPILDRSLEAIRKILLPLLENNVTPVVPGFIGKTLDGRITTLGRGGSDTTAFLIAQALSAGEVILATDVDGIMTADPKLVKGARKIDELKVEELIGLTNSGKKFIHRKALRYKPEEIDVKIVNSARGDLNVEGTIITGSFPKDLSISIHESPAVAVTIVGKELSKASRVMLSLFGELEEKGIDLLGMSIDYNSLIMYLPESAVQQVLDGFHGVVLKSDRVLALAVSPKLALIRVRGAYLSETPGVLNTLSEAIYSRGMNIYGVFTITSSICLFVDWSKRVEALETLEETVKRFKLEGELFRKDNKPLT